MDLPYYGEWASAARHFKCHRLLHGVTNDQPEFESTKAERVIYKAAVQRAGEEVSNMYCENTSNSVQPDMDELHTHKAEQVILGSFLEMQADDIYLLRLCEDTDRLGATTSPSGWFCSLFSTCILT